MTRARARRWFVDEHGHAWDLRRDADLSARLSGGTFVECIPVPRVTVREDTKLHLSVLLNGEFVRAFNDRELAKNYATALRRALRGK